MKYILLASVLSAAVYAAPFAAGTTGRNGAGQAQAAAQQQGTQGVQNGGANAAGGAQRGGANAAANTPTGTGAGIANGQTPSAADLATAVANWMADTSMVSDFMNRGASIQNNVQFKQAATVAFNAEVDELTHKAIIDAALGTDPNVIAANSTLATGGAFQDVVDKLQQMSTKGRAAVGNIDLINQNRCVNGKFLDALNQRHNANDGQSFPTSMPIWRPPARPAKPFAPRSVTRLVLPEVFKVSWSHDTSS
jgi:hypothetical protein